MTTTKPTTGTVPPKTTQKQAPSPQELQAAYQIHTLAHMMFGPQMGVRPWMSQMPMTPPVWNTPWAQTPTETMTPWSMPTAMPPYGMPMPWTMPPMRGW